MVILEKNIFPKKEKTFQQTMKDLIIEIMNILFDFSFNYQKY
tara:strand:+ start:367 stop:492 length:126 start_codon:yes stop_codon:yes gene_type:complete